MSDPNIITRAQRAARGYSTRGKTVTPSVTPLAQPQLPSNWQMFKNLVTAAGEAVKSGFDVRGPEETEAILKICAECPRLIENEGNPRCASCGCYLTVKSRVKSAHCPEGKW